MLNILSKVKNRLNAALHTQIMTQRVMYAMRNNWLMDKVLNSNEPGTSVDKICEQEVIVSITSYDKRIYDAPAAIESIMQGSLKPNRIILWLGEEMRDTVLPIALRRQQKRGLEICYCKDIGPYTKLIPALRCYPQSIIITIDDDAAYAFDMVEKLVATHTKYPGSIIANRFHRIVLSPDGRPVSYMKWKWRITEVEENSPLNFFTGVGGVLYPPGCLPEETLNEAVFTHLCRYADDIWLNAMALLGGTTAKKCPTHDKYGEEYICNPDIQDTGLLNINIGKECANDRQMKAVFDHYKLWDKLKP